MYTYMNNFQNWPDAFVPLGIALPLFALWSLFWKGLALWHAAGRKQSWWFFVILIVNAGGLLEIIYLFLVLKLKLSELFNKK